MLKRKKKKEKTHRIVGTTGIWVVISDSCTSKSFWEKILGGAGPYEVAYFAGNLAYLSYRAGRVTHELSLAKRLLKVVEK